MCYFCIVNVYIESLILLQILSAADGIVYMKIKWLITYKIFIQKYVLFQKVWEVLEKDKIMQNNRRKVYKIFVT